MQPAANISVNDREQTIQPNKKTGAFLGNLKHTATALVAALGLASSAEAQNPIQSNHIPLGAMNPIELNTLKTNSTDHQEALTSLTFTTTTAGTINVKMNYFIDGINIGTASGQTVDLGGIIQREFTGLPTVAILDTTGIAEGLTGTTGNLSARFDQKSTIENPLLDTFSVSGPGTYTLSYKGILDSKYITGQMLFGNATATDLNTPIQVNFTPNPEPPPPADVNANGIADKWEYYNFGMLTPAGGDPDGDGQTNLIEYAFGTNPIVANTSTITCNLEDGGDGQKYLTISFGTRNPLPTNLDYTVEGSNDLNVWEEVKKVTDMTTQKVRDIVPISSAPRRFLRFKIEPKLSIQ